MILKNTNRAILVVVLLAAFLNGCGPREEYQRLAKAGKTYTTSMDTLLTVAGKIHVDSSSEQLLAQDRVANRRDVEFYLTRSEENRKRLNILADLQKHNQLLGKYFSLLDELASSDAPQKAEAEINNIVGNLTTIGQKLRVAVPSSGSLPILGKLIVDSQISEALRREFELRKDLINQELIVEEDVLRFVAGSMKSEMEIIKSLQENRLVVRPFTQDQPISDEEKWIANRQRIMTMTMTISELDTAQQAARSFRGIFVDLAGGTLNSERLNSLLTDIESFLTFVEKLKINRKV